MTPNDFDLRIFKHHRESSVSALPSLNNRNKKPISLQTYLNHCLSTKFKVIYTVLVSQTETVLYVLVV